jgi:hypothetical protein
MDHLDFEDQRGGENFRFSQTLRPLIEVCEALSASCAQDVAEWARALWLKSHHEGYSELLEPKFDARLVGNPASAMNLRYLAALLRVADVLEFDPERTPSIILQHRKIAPKSRIFWHRDQGIAFEIIPDKPELILSARTPGALIHKAVLSVATYVNIELACCHHLQQQGAFLRGVISDSDREKYRWQLPSQLSLDVKEKDDNFTYIDGTFRPDVTKLLGLLSTTETARFHS